MTTYALHDIEEAASEALGLAVSLDDSMTTLAVLTAEPLED